MKKNSLITLFIVIIIVGVLVGINIIGIKKNSTLTCIRDYKDRVVYTFDENGIKNIKINDKALSKKKLMEYKLRFASDFSWNRVSNNNYIDIIKEHMEDVVSYEENELEEISQCDFEKNDD